MKIIPTVEEVQEAKLINAKMEFFTEMFLERYGNAVKFRELKYDHERYGYVLLHSYETARGWENCSFIEKFLYAKGNADIQKNQHYKPYYDDKKEILIIKK